MFLLAVLLSFTCILYALSLVRLVRQKRAFARDIPLHTPKTTFLGMDLTLAVQNEVERFDLLWQMFWNQDRVFKMLIGPLMCIGVSHPDLMQKVLSHSDCLEKPFFYDFVQLENGIFSAKYKLWKSQRKALNPTFNLRILNSFVPVFVDCSRRMVAELAKCEDGSTVDMFQFTSKCTLEMVCATTLGSSVLERDGKDEFLHNLEGLFELFARRMLSIELFPDCIYRMTSYHRRQNMLRRKIDKFAGKIIHEKRSLHFTHSKIHQLTQPTKDEEDFRKPQIFINQLFSLSNSSRPFTDDEILHNVITVMIAGNDTSGLGVAHACLFLAMYPDIQQKVYAEVMKHFPETEDIELNAESLRRLEYTEMFIKECLRHCPVAPTIARQSLVELELDGFKIPAGNIFVFSFYALHRRKDIWGLDAEKFDPENFSPERSKDRHPYAFMPFSNGARNCIGGRYAMLSMKVMIVDIVRNFELKTELRHCDLKYKFGLTLKLPFAHSIQVFRRNAETNDQ
ncbi:cytochrome P450 4g15-like [Ochlerotatus camptorhynchus]|uniref:cytochrome P450 4g15-like n=1 Tax=Ochlerotatus camptorhynchus TaxID=644619 RepID=UPI0031D3F7E5